MPLRALNSAPVTTTDPPIERSAPQPYLTVPLLAHALLRIASGTSGTLIPASKPSLVMDIAERRESLT